MVFRALAVFSLLNESISPQTHSQDKCPSQPFRNASNTPLTGAEQNDNPLSPLSRQHDVSQQSTDLYDYPGTMFTVFGRCPAPLKTMSQQKSPARRRKLRKLKPDYHQLRYQPPTVEQMASPRPESILSTHSRTPLLDHSRAASSSYAPRRTPNKLEKRDKTRRMASMAASSSLGFTALEISSRELSRSSRGNEDVLSPQPMRSPSSIGTEDLVSFAWTGELENSEPSSAHHISENSSFTQHRPRSRTKSDCAAKQRTSILRKPNVNAQRTCSPRPWSLAMVLSDDKITDEKLVGQLEDMRLKGLSQRRRCLSASYPSLTYQTVLDDSYAEYPPEPDEFASDDLSDSSWTTARQALLICREMLRTERRYLSSLRILAKGATATFPPLTVFYHLPLLITASEEFLQSMTKNPSVRGVSEAFLAVQDKLDEAFVDWCSVVGTFFADDGGKARSDSEDSYHQPVAKIRRTTSTPIPDTRNSTLDTLIIIEPNKIRRNSKNRPSVRELAILPTQRIVRYVLLFKELSALTPPSSSFVVAEALHAAQIIAKHSDEAQANAAFLVPST